MVENVTQGRSALQEWMEDLAYVLGILVMLPMTIFIFLFRISPIMAVGSYVIFFGGIYFLLKGYAA